MRKYPRLILSTGLTYFVLSCALLFSVTAQAHLVPSSAKMWKQTAIMDINEAYQVLRDNHPGTYDPKNPDFVTQLEQAKERGLSLAMKVSDANSYKFALQGFTAVLGDGHAGVMGTMDSQMKTPTWPGFHAVWRQQGLFVAISNIDGISVGAEVVACDGKPIKTLIEDNVFSFLGRKDELGLWWTMASYVFIDFHNPFITVPRHCVFRVSNKTIEKDLLWSEVHNNTWSLFGSMQVGDVKDVGVTEPRPKLLWVSMPSFKPNEQQQNTYRAIYAELKSDHQRYDNADALVIDLRKNQGGSSQWSADFANALWGEAAVTQRKLAKAKNQQVWWRVSKDNTAYVQHEMMSFLKATKQIEMANFVGKIGVGMKTSLQKGEKFYVEDSDEPDEVKSTPPVENTIAATYHKPVYVIVPGNCASACLDALDTFTLFENTSLIGAPSSGDSTYMEVRYQPTASELAKIIIPNKVYVNRYRGNGEIYLPDIYVNDLEWSSANFLRHIEKDLAGRKP